MDPLRDDLIPALADREPRPGRTPVHSTVTNASTDGSGFDTAYWSRNPRDTVRFSAAVRSLPADGETVLIEIGPHPVLVNAINEIIEGSAHGGIALPSLRRDCPDRVTLLESAGAVCATGHELDWTALRGCVGGPPSIPTYPWQRRRYWLGKVAKHSTTRPNTSASQGVAGGSSPAAPARRERTNPVVQAMPQPSPKPPRAREQSQEHLTGPAATILGLPAADVARTKPLTICGLDSRLAAELVQRIKQEFAIYTPISLLLRNITLEKITENILPQAGKIYDALTVIQSKHRRATRRRTPTRRNRHSRRHRTPHQLRPGTGWLNGPRQYSPRMKLCGERCSRPAPAGRGPAARAPRIGEAWLAGLG